MDDDDDRGASNSGGSPTSSPPRSSSLRDNDDIFDHDDDRLSEQRNPGNRGARTSTPPRSSSSASSARPLPRHSPNAGASSRTSKVPRSMGLLFNFQNKYKRYDVPSSLPWTHALRNKLGNRKWWSKALLRNFPFIQIFRGYKIKEDFPSDLVSGLTVGIMQIPQSKSCANTVNTTFDLLSATHSMINRA